jgi:hypothetical protein
MALLVARGRWLKSVDLLPAIFVVFLNARLKLSWLIAVRCLKRQDLSSLEDIDHYFNATPVGRNRLEVMLVKKCVISRWYPDSVSSK